MSDARTSFLSRLLVQPYRFGTTCRRTARSASDEAFESIALGLMIWSGVWGVLIAWVWGLAWHVFRDLGTSELVMPAAVTTIVLVLWPLRESIVSLARVLAPRRPTVRAVVVSSVVVLLALSLYRLRAEWARDEYPLEWFIAWARPLCKIYRVLILMPAWGAWSMLIACQFCRRRPAIDPAAGALARTCGPVTAAIWMAVVLSLTMAYYNYLGLGAQLVIPGLTLAMAIASGAVLCCWAKGLSRTVLLASSCLTQLVHLLVFLVYQ